MAFVYQVKQKKINFNLFKILIVEDPVYGTITVPYPYSEIILTKEMMRSKDIGQNGFSTIVYPEIKNNNRLNHCVGAFYIMQKIITHFEKLGYHISEENKVLAFCSIIVHDIGHGPFSHSFEVITGYSHEKRTADILLGDTEIHHLLVKMFGPKMLKKIVSFITETNPSREDEDPFSRLLRNLISHQLDADRLDYLIRDAYYVNRHPDFDIDVIIDSMQPLINANQEYELFFDEKALRHIENLFIHRFQMYRDVYVHPYAVLGDLLFKKTIELASKSPGYNPKEVKSSFHTLVKDASRLDTKTFLILNEGEIDFSLDVLSKNKKDPLLAYLAKKQNALNYLKLEKNVSKKVILSRINDIFSTDLKDSCSIIEGEANVKLYNKTPEIKMKKGNTVRNFSACTTLIQPQEKLEEKWTFFNPEVLRLELGLSIEEFERYRKEIDHMIEDLNKSQEEFELKYLVSENTKTLLPSLISNFLENGFQIEHEEDKINEDRYSDTCDFDFFKSQRQLRTRRKNSKQFPYLATFKSPLDIGETFSSRNELECPLPDNDHDTLVKNMQPIVEKHQVDLSNLLPEPVLHVTTKRHNITLTKNGVKVCLSLDDSEYCNVLFPGAISQDQMIEIEVKSEVTDRSILNEIDSFISSSYPHFVRTKQNKYERGIHKTIRKAQETIRDLPFCPSEYQYKLLKQKLPI